MNWSEIIEKWSKIRVLVLGDVMIDRYMHGRVNRISPESPVPVFDHNHSTDHLGGAANVALNCHALGAQTYLCGVIGKDQEGQVFTHLLARPMAMPYRRMVTGYPKRHFQACCPPSFIATPSFTHCAAR